MCSSDEAAGDLLESYLLSHISPEPPHLAEVYRRTYLRHLYPRMCSGHLQGRVLSMLSAMVAPRRILELGTFTGYSALSLAEGLVPGGQLHTVEIDDEMEAELHTLFASAPGGDRITLHIGDAEEVVPRLSEEWDLVYIDADKRHYRQYLDLVLPRVRPGGFIIADNTLWSGKVAAPPATKADPQTAALRDFNDYVATRPDLATVILPLRDGLTLLRRLGPGM